MAEPIIVRRHTGKSFHKRSAALNEGLSPAMPLAAQASATTSSAPASARPMPRSVCSASAPGRSAAGRKRSSTKAAPTVASQPVSARLTGTNSVFHSGRERTTIISAPV